MMAALLQHSGIISRVASIHLPLVADLQVFRSKNFQPHPLLVGSLCRQTFEQGWTLFEAA